MSRDEARLKHLLATMEARYGSQDVDVRQLREEVDRVSADEARRLQPLRYVGASPFADRATRLLQRPD